MKIIKTATKEAVFSKFTYISALGLMVAFFLSTVWVTADDNRITLLQYVTTVGKKWPINSAESLLIVQMSDCLNTIYPFIAGFMTVSVICDKKKSGYSRFSVFRMGYRRYALHSIIQILVTAFITTIIAYGTYAITVICINGSELELTTAVKIIICKTVLIWTMLVFGGMLTLIAAQLSFNKYISLLIPVYICYVLRSISLKQIMLVDYTKPDWQKTYTIAALTDPSSISNIYDISNLNGLENIYAYPLFMVLIVTIIAYIVGSKAGRQV